jgi:hypothetical protein
VPQFDCPFHPDEIFAPADAERGGSAVAPCGRPIRLCPNCGWPNRTFALACRHCGSALDRYDPGPTIERMLRHLWTHRNGDGGNRVSVLELPSAVGTVTVLAEHWGYLFVGTDAGRILIFNALAPSQMLGNLALAGAVTHIDAAPPLHDAEVGSRGPQLVVTTSEAFVRVALLPEVHTQPLAGRPAAPAQVLEQGVMTFVAAGDDSVQPVWTRFDALESPTSVGEPIPGPIAQPLRVGPERVFFFGPHGARMVDMAAREDRPVALSYALQPGVAPSYDPANDDAYVVYGSDGGYGAVRIGMAELQSWRVTDPEYGPIQLCAVDRRAVCIATANDLQFVSPATGRLTWGLRRNLQIDTLDLVSQPVRRAGPFLLLLGRRRPSTSLSIYFFPIGSEGLANGPQPVAEVESALVPPLACAAGIVCARRTGRSPSQLVIVSPGGTA